MVTGRSEQTPRRRVTRRRARPTDDDAVVGEREAIVAEQGEQLLDLYDRALPEVYGYVVRRCGDRSLAEDLTAEVFLAAVSAVQRGTVPDLTVAWLIAVSRNKLVDHWRQAARLERTLTAVAEHHADEDGDWTDALDEGAALATLRRLGSHHQAALSLRYLDDLPVPAVADHLGRTVHATEALLIRAKAAFRKAYREEGDRG
jgi:RNA polymerase sigma-70 factor (ECF subfamily)